MGPAEVDFIRCAIGVKRTEVLQSAADPRRESVKLIHNGFGV
jgi:hypothetical protein